ncbi:unnamed protein product [Trichobilharzia regenti]|nr:unnamed protein product [Trichobilharzia regenti]
MKVLHKHKSTIRNLSKKYQRLILSSEFIQKFAKTKYTTDNESQYALLLNENVNNNVISYSSEVDIESNNIKAFVQNRYLEENFKHTAYTNNSNNTSSLLFEYTSHEIKDSGLNQFQKSTTDCHSTSPSSSSPFQLINKSLQNNRICPSLAKLTKNNEMIPLYEFYSDDLQVNCLNVLKRFNNDNNYKGGYFDSFVKKFKLTNQYHDNNSNKWYQSKYINYHLLTHSDDDDDDDVEAGYRINIMERGKVDNDLTNEKMNLPLFKQHIGSEQSKTLEGINNGSHNILNSDKYKYENIKRTVYNVHLESIDRKEDMIKLKRNTVLHMKRSDKVELQ